MRGLGKIRCTGHPCGYPGEFLQGLKASLGEVFNGSLSSIDCQQHGHSLERLDIQDDISMFCPRSRIKVIPSLIDCDGRRVVRHRLSQPLLPVSFATIFCRLQFAVFVSHAD